LAILYAIRDLAIGSLLYPRVLSVVYSGISGMLRPVT